MRSIRWIHALCLASLLFWLNAAGALPANAEASLHVNNPGNKLAGELVTISGSAPWSEVTIKVVRPDHTVAYFDIATVAAGTYTTAFRLAADALAGTYTIVAGRGDIVATVSFTVTASSGGGTDTGTNPGNGTGNGTDNETGNETGTETGQEPGNEALGFRIGGQSFAAARTTNAQGMIEATADIATETLLEALAQAALANPAAPIALLTFEGDATAWHVRLPVEAVLAAAADNAAAAIRVQANGATYELQFNRGALQAAIADFVQKPAGSYIMLSLAEASGELADEIAAAAAQHSAELAHSGYMFNLAIQEGKRTLPVAGFADAAVSRTMTIDRAIDPATSTVALFDRQSGSFAFVPSTFETVNGVTTASIRHQGNGSYAIITQEKSFTDLAGHWAQADILLLAAKGIANGQPSGSFAPDAAITRAQFTALLVRALGLPQAAEGHAAVAAFSDVAEHAWYAGAVAAATNAGLIHGYGDGTFQPDRVLSREQLAVLAMRALQAAGVADSGFALGGGEDHRAVAPADQTTVVIADALADQFTDSASISGWARDAVAYLAQEQLIHGYPNGAFAPELTATRAQASTILIRILGYAAWVNE